MQFGGNEVETTMALSLAADDVLVVESTAPNRGGGPPTSTELRYSRDA